MNLDLILYKYTIDVVERYAGGRNLLFWGECKELQEILKCKGFECIDVTYSKEKIGSDVHYIEEFSFKSAENFVIVPWLEFTQKRKKALEHIGYTSKDYVFARCPEIRMLTNEETEYHDNWNNDIVSRSRGISIVMKKPSNNSIYIGERVTGNSTIYVTSSNVTVDIQDDVMLKDAYIYLNAGASLHIGKKTTFNHGANINVTNCSSLNIGEDCMFSFGCTLHCGDAHAIFELENGRRINPLGNRNVIKIGNHVWCGFNSNVLAPFEIGNDSVIGAGSLCKGIFGNNVIVAGSPTRLIRERITWERDNGKEEWIFGND